MINTGSAAKLVEYSKIIQQFAKRGDKKVQTEVSREAHRRAWSLLTKLVKFATHIEQSDFYWLLADDEKRTKKDRIRCETIAKREDFGLVLTGNSFEHDVAEFAATDIKSTKKTAATKAKSAAKTSAAKTAKTAKTAKPKDPIDEAVAQKSLVAKKAVAKKSVVKKPATKSRNS